jgi:hypothetical protein
LRASALSGLAQTFALVGAPIFGRCWYMDFDLMLRQSSLVMIDVMWYAWAVILT